MDLLSLVSAMLSTDRDERPTASQVKEQFAAIATKHFASTGEQCPTCQRKFISKNALRKHVKKAGHARNNTAPMQASNTHLSRAQGPQMQDFKTNYSANPYDPQMTIRGAADAPTKYFYDDAELDAPESSICMACDKHFKTKRQLYAHLAAGHHFRSAKYIQKRKAEFDPATMDRKEGRFIKWMRKDMHKGD